MFRAGRIIKFCTIAAVFILLEVAALIMLKNNGPMQNIWISKGTHAVQAVIWGGTERIRDYFSLRKQNEKLAEENFRLSQAVRQYGQMYGNLPADSIPEVIGNYRYQEAEVVKVSNNKQHNYLIIDKGAADGISAMSGIITSQGVIGIIDAVGEHYSYARSFKNSGMVVSARIGRTGAAGEIIWDGISSNGAILREIPRHIPLHQGDTVYTSGFSSIFPADIPLGTTGEATVVNGSTYNIGVTLFADFSAIRYVTVVNNMNTDEIKELEDSNENQL